MTMIEIVVSWRGTVGPGRPAETVHAPDPGSGRLAAVLAQAGLERLGRPQPLPWTPQRLVAPDFLLVLRAPEGAAAAGLPEAEVQRLGSAADGRMLAYVGGQYRVIDPKVTEKTSLNLW